MEWAEYNLGEYLTFAYFRTQYLWYFYSNHYTVTWSINKGNRDLFHEFEMET